MIYPSKRTLKKRREDTKAQLAYLEEHRWCEVCGKRAWEVHEVIARSHGGECEDDNMISLDRDCHNRAHFKKSPYLYREELWKIKGLDSEVMQEKLRRIRKGVAP